MTVEHYTQRHLRMRKDQPAHIRFLLWIGFVRFGRKDFSWLSPEVIRWPFSAPPMHMFRHHLRCPGQRVYIFSNPPGVIKWLPGRLLPRRWGFGILGFEFGDRG